jgi:cell division control protein 6
VSGEVIERCANLSSDERGDARRAIDLLRAAAEVAGAAGEKAIGLAHVEAAVAQLQKEKVELAIARAPYHARVACAGLARVAFLAPGQAWYATSTLYRQYCSSLQKGARALGYRRFSELLIELGNLGLAASQVGSKGRQGYGLEYRLAVPPEVVGAACFPAWWGELLRKKRRHEEDLEACRERSQDKEVHEYGRRGAPEALAHEKEKWIEFVGL